MKSNHSRQVLDKVLVIVNKYENAGKAFFNRNSSDNMVINVRDPRIYGGNNNDHWETANTIEQEVREAGGRTSGVEIDSQSGTLVFSIKKIYLGDLS